MVALKQVREKRNSKRHSVIWAGTISIAPGQKPIDCTIMNISPHGAHLSVEPGQLVPDRFLLNLPTGSKPFSSRKVWRIGNELGVEFVGACLELTNDRKVV